MPLTVAQLVARLSELPPELPVFFDSRLDEEPVVPIDGADLELAPSIMAVDPDLDDPVPAPPAVFLV